MIAFTRLGTLGRLGNQLFQYAFIRSRAIQLGVKFYCPPWEGDELFDLRDQDGRVVHPEPLRRFYVEPRNCGFNTGAITAGDHVDYLGCFQSERYFVSAAEIRSWYTFREPVVETARQHYAHVELEHATGISFRFGDFSTSPYHFILAERYYEEALGLLEPRSGPVVAFSDDAERARVVLNRIGLDASVVGGHPHHQLWAMTRCRQLILTNSTFAWWGAWLNDRSGTVVISPREWVRPGSSQGGPDLPRSWRVISAARWPEDTMWWYTVTHPSFVVQTMRSSSARVIRGIRRLLGLRVKARPVPGLPVV